MVNACSNGRDSLEDKRSDRTGIKPALITAWKFASPRHSVRARRFEAFRLHKPSFELKQSNHFDNVLDEEYDEGLTARM